MPNNPTSENASEKTTDRSATALNHLTHSGTANTLFLKDEDPAAFFSLLESAFEQHHPANTQDASLVTDSVLARWLLLRRQRVIIHHEAALHTHKPQPDQWTSTDLAYVQLLDRYKTQAERGLKRALANLGHIQKDVLAEQRWQAQHEMQKERFALERERFELAKLKEARLAEKLARREAAKETLDHDLSPEPDPPS